MKKVKTISKYILNILFINMIYTITTLNSVSTNHILRKCYKSTLTYISSYWNITFSLNFYFLIIFMKFIKFQVSFSNKSD